MNRRIVAVGVVVLLLSVAIVVQILDPRFEERTPPEVDFSEPPNEVAADAAKQFEYVDYAYRVEIKRNGSGGWRQVRTMQVDHSDREYYKTGPLGEQGVVLYGTDAVTFVRPGEEAPWRVTFLREILYHPMSIGEPFLIDRIRSSNASIVAENQTTVVLHIDVHPLDVAEYLPGDAVLRINKNTGLVEFALVSYGPKPSHNHYLRFRLTETGADVHRPSEIPLSPWEAFWDVLRGPIVNL